MANYREEISDIIPDKLWENPDFKKGFVLRFDKATIKITKVNKKAKRVWGEHVELVEQIVAKGHYGHNVDVTEQPPYCSDCEVYINEPANELGKTKAKDREENELSDGTRID